MAAQTEPACDRRVLLLDNSRSFAAMVAAAITDRLGLSVTVAASLADAKRMLDDGQRFFLALTGLVLSDASEEGVVDFFTGLDMPVVVFTGVYDDDVRRRILNRSIIDYVLKSTPGSVDYLVWLVRRLDRNRSMTALVVDDFRTDRIQIARLLSLCGYKVMEAATGADALKLLDENPAIRLVITDQEMPGMDGVEFVRQARTRHPADRVAIIGLSGLDVEGRLVARFLKNGANDFLRKPFCREEFFCRVSQNADRLELIGSLREMASQDFLTGLSNRRHFFDQANRLFEHEREAERSLAAAMIDLDHFKRINDSWGHEAGDAVLKAAAGALSAATRQGDLVARFGGEEFCVLAVGLPDEQAEPFFERVRAAIAGLNVQWEGKAIPVTTSIGVCVGRRASLNAMLAEADQALYRAKSDGRDRVEISRRGSY